MDMVRPQHVSVIDPINPAIERVKLILFQPFDLGRWFIIGFCAWLALLGQGGGGGNMNFNIGQEQHTHQVELEQAKQYVVEHLVPIVIIGSIIFVLVVALWLLITWLSSRGRFMFLYCVAQNKAEVTAPWSRFRDHGNNLFIFRVVLGLIGSVCLMAPLVVGGLASFWLGRDGIGVAAIMAIVATVLVVVIIGAVFGIVAKFTQDFVVPVMYLYTASCTEAWRRFLVVLAANKGRFALYILFQILLSLIIGVMVGIICLIGMCFCCISLLLVIPYIGTVVLLPVFVFTQSYVVYYLRQYGPEFDVFLPEAAVVA